MDESVVIHDAIARKVWAPMGLRPICVVTGSHQRTVLFGALSLDGRQLFRQYASFNPIRKPNQTWQNRKARLTDATVDPHTTDGIRTLL